MGDAGALTALVERESFVRNRQVDDAVRPQFAKNAIIVAIGSSQCSMKWFAMMKSIDSSAIVARRLAICQLCPARRSFWRQLGILAAGMSRDRRSTYPSP